MEVLPVGEWLDDSDSDRKVKQLNELGMRAAHAIITANCRTIERPGQLIISPNRQQQDNDEFALERAVEKIRETYKASLAGWRSQGTEPTFNLVLFVERPTETES